MLHRKGLIIATMAATLLSFCGCTASNGTSEPSAQQPKARHTMRASDAVGQAVLPPLNGESSEFASVISELSDSK